MIISNFDSILFFVGFGTGPFTCVSLYFNGHNPVSQVLLLSSFLQVKQLRHRKLICPDAYS